MNHQLLKADLQQVLGCEVRLENDANCLALSEAMDGAGAQAQVVFAAILGTGCGGGLVVAMQPYVFGIQVNTPVLAAQHGDSSGVRGAAWLCR